MVRSGRLKLALLEDQEEIKAAYCYKTGESETFGRVDLS